jgi:hypothetical protein
MIYFLLVLSTAALLLLILVWFVATLSEWSDRSNPTLCRDYPINKRNLRSVLVDQWEHIKRFKL